MRTYIIRRLLSGVGILFFLSIIVFILLRVLAGDPAALRCGLSCTPDGIAQARPILGTDKPYFPIELHRTTAFLSFHTENQYLTWIKDLVTGHLGKASINQKPILDTMRYRLPVTLELLIITTVLTI